MKKIFQSRFVIRLLECMGIHQKNASPCLQEKVNDSDACAALINYLNCPCTVFSGLLDDSDMVSAYEQAVLEGKENGFTPLLIVADDAFLQEMDLEADNDSDADAIAEKLRQCREAIIKEAMSIDGEQFLQEKTERCVNEFVKNEADREELYGKIKGNDVRTTFAAYWDYDSKLSKRVVLAKIPTKNPWEVAAWIPMGGFNDCPSSAQQVAVMKYWFEKYGAVPATVSSDEWEFCIDKPITDKNEAMKLALEHFGFCFDRIMQYSTEEEDYTIGNLAAGLMKSTKWYFWWD